MRMPSRRTRRRLLALSWEAPLAVILLYELGLMLKGVLLLLS